MAFQNGRKDSNPGSNTGNVNGAVLPSEQPDDPDNPRFKYRLIDYKGTKIFADFLTMMPEVEEFSCQSDDIFLASFPKSGTTWMETIITLIMNHGDVQSIPHDRQWVEGGWRFGHIEARYTNTNLSMALGGELVNTEFIGQIRRMSRPRKIKTHLPYNLLPEDVRAQLPKIIYVYRNVKDVMVSLYYHYLHLPMKLHDMANCTFPIFAERFMNGQVENAPYFHHLSSYWQNRQKSNFFLISFEELKTDHAGSIREIAKFLGIPVTDDEVELVRVNSTVEGMRKAKVSDLPEDIRLEGHNMIRSGKMGSWKTHFTKELNERTDDWIKKNVNQFKLDSNSMAAALDY